MNKSLPRRLFVLLVATSISQSLTAQAADDASAIKDLRTRLEQAMLSQEPALIGELLTEDFVYIQNNWQGPTTYGKRFFLDYWPSNDPVVSAKIQLIHPAEIFGDWALEQGETEMIVRINGEEVPRISRFQRILHKKDGRWKYAREISRVAEDLMMRKAPPVPEKITNSGRAFWSPMESPDAVEELLDAEAACRTQTLISEDSAYVLNCFWDHDADYPLIFGGGSRWGDYVALRHALQRSPYDEFERYYKEVIADGNFGLAWGYAVETGVHLDDGHRWYGVAVVMYVWRKTGDGRWKVYNGYVADLIPDP